MKNGRILSFPLNLPAVVTLGSAEHTVIQGRYGERAHFTLADGRSMYVPPCVATKIIQQGITAGDTFELCKLNVKRGRRNTIEWVVRRVDPQAASQESQIEHDLRESIEQAKAKTETPPNSSPGVTTISGLARRKWRRPFIRARLSRKASCHLLACP